MLTVGELKKQLEGLPDDATIGTINLPNASELKVFSEYVKVIDRKEFKNIYLEEWENIPKELIFDYYL